MIKAMIWPLYLQETELISIVQEAGWCPQPVWMSAESPVPIRI